MYSLFDTPTWFNGWDIGFELIILLIALLVAAYSWRVYRVNKENRFAYFSLAFILIAIGLSFKVITSGNLYFTPVRDITVGVLRPLAGPGLSYTHLMYRAGFFLQMLPMLAGWLLIFFISQKSRARLRKFHEVSQIALFVYLITLISIVANFKYFVFYLTSAVLLALIVLNYYKNYLTTRSNNAFLVMVSFLFLLFGNLAYVFVSFSNGLYVFGEVLTLIGFLLLLLVYRKVTKFKRKDSQ